jgi:hypothetical protein
MSPIKAILIFRSHKDVIFFHLVGRATLLGFGPAPSLKPSGYNKLGLKVKVSLSDTKLLIRRSTVTFSL